MLVFSPCSQRSTSDTLFLLKREKMATMFPPCSHKVHCLRIIVCSMILSSLRNATLFCFFSFWGSLFIYHVSFFSAYHLDVTLAESSPRCPAALIMFHEYSTVQCQCMYCIMNVRLFLHWVWGVFAAITCLLQSHKWVTFDWYSFFIYFPYQH